MDRPVALPASVFAHFTDISTRWIDNDAYGHINNVVYYEFFDTVFRGSDTTASAQGHFVHVYVDRATGKPVPLPEALKTALAKLS